MASSVWTLTVVLSTMEAAIEMQTASEPAPTLRPAGVGWASVDQGDTVTLSTPAKVTMVAAVSMLAVSTLAMVKGIAPASEVTWAMASIVGEAPTMKCFASQRTPSFVGCFHNQGFVVFTAMDRSLSSAL